MPALLRQVAWATAALLLAFCRPAVTSAGQPHYLILGAPCAGHTQQYRPYPGQATHVQRNSYSWGWFGARAKPRVTYPHRYYKNYWHPHGHRGY